MELVLTTSSIHILTKTKLTTKKTNLNYFLCKYNIFLSKLQTFSAFLIKKHIYLTFIDYFILKFIT